MPVDAGKDAIASEQEEGEEIWNEDGEATFTTTSAAAAASNPAPPQSEDPTASGVRFDTSEEDSSDPTGGRNDSVRTTDSTSTSNVDKLRDDLAEIQHKLGRALRLRRASSLVKDKHAGQVDVDFVRTKPSRRARARCKKAIRVKTILHKFHADFPEGCVTALMGPSGAGKTTLLDFLTGMLGDGVHACGKVALPDDDAYVPQDDRLHGFYTCQMYMEHYARLRGMKPTYNCCSSKKKVSGDVANEDEDEDEDEEGGVSNAQDDVEKLIEDILSEVGLTNQKHTVVGGLFTRGLSGGQKRRLSVALEALSSPLNLFLDEPTSGLDSESALALMQYLNSYARGRDPKTNRRRRVIVTIHQPSSHIWELIDNVVLLAEGRLMYQGPRQSMADFFEQYGHPVPVHYNPADHYIEVLFKSPDVDEDGDSEISGTPNVFEMWSKCFRKWTNDETDTTNNTLTESLMATAMTRQKTIVIRQDSSERKREKFRAFSKKSARSAIELTRRSFVDLLRNPIVLGLRMAIYGGMSIMIGILFFGLQGQTDVHSILLSRTALLYFIIAFCSSMSVAVIPFAIVDRAIVQKEVRNHMYHPAFYHASQSLASVPVCLVLAIVVSVIVLAMTGMGDAGTQTNVLFGLILFLTFLCADATSMFVAHISPEMISAICISSGIFGVCTMVMGFMVTPSNMPAWLSWLYYVPFMTYSFRSLMHLEYSGLRFYDASDVEQIIPGDFTGTGQELIRRALESDLEGNLQGVEGFLLNSTGYSADGNAILKSFEMEDVNLTQDVIVLIIWGIAMHVVSIIYLSWTNHKSRRMFVYSDE